MQLTHFYDDTRIFVVYRKRHVLDRQVTYRYIRPEVICLSGVTIVCAVSKRVDRVKFGICA